MAEQNRNSNASRTSGGSSAPSASGTTLGGPPKLKIVESEVVVDTTQCLGEGGFGVVYAGVLRNSTRVAVKKIKAPLDERVTRAFIKEVVTWEGLVQRNILPLMAYCLNPPMLVTELMEDGNLWDYLDEHNWDQPVGRRMATEVASGMAYLHNAGILHGDLKSLNVLVDGTRPLIADFGLSQLRTAVSTSTNGGQMPRGTLPFMAPEILQGKGLQPAGDVWAFGMLLYEVVSRGKVPFEDVENFATIAFTHVGERRQRPRRPHNVPDLVWMLMERCWQQEPTCRPDFDQIHTDLKRINATLPTTT